MNHFSEFQSKTIFVLYLIFAVRKWERLKKEKSECNILFLLSLLNKLRYKNNSTVKWAKPPSQICTSLQLKRAEVFRNRSLKHSTVAKDFKPLSTWTLEERFCKELQEALNYIPQWGAKLHNFPPLHRLNYLTHPFRIHTKLKDVFTLKLIVSWKLLKQQSCMQSVMTQGSGF